MSRASDNLTPRERADLLELTRSIRVALTLMVQRGLMPPEGWTLAAFREALTAAHQGLLLLSKSPGLTAEARAMAAEGARRFAELGVTDANLRDDAPYVAALTAELARLRGEPGVH